MLVGFLRHSFVQTGCSGNEARSACPQLDVDIEETKEEDKQDEQTLT